MISPALDSYPQHVADSLDRQDVYECLGLAGQRVTPEMFDAATRDPDGPWILQRALGDLYRDEQEDR